MLRAKPSAWFGDEKVRSKTRCQWVDETCTRICVRAEIHTQPTSDKQAGTRPMSEHSWWWQTDAGGWEQFDEFNSASLEQAFSDDRQVTRLNFPGGAKFARRWWVMCFVFQHLDAGFPVFASTRTGRPSEWKRCRESRGHDDGRKSNPRR